MMPPLREPQNSQEFFQIGFIWLLVIEQDRKDDILLDRQLWDQVEALKDKTNVAPPEDRQIAFSHRENILAIDEDLSCTGCVHGTDHVQERTLA